MKLSVDLRQTITRLTTFLIMAAPAYPFRVAIANPIIQNSAPTNLDQLHKPSKSPPSDLEAAYNSISDVPDDQLIRIPIPSPNPKDQLVVEETFDHSTRQEIPITAGQIRNMLSRAAALIQRNSINSISGFTPEQKQNSILLVSMDLNNLAQLESCVYVDADGNIYDNCLIDLVVRDLNSGKRWLYRGVLVDKFMIYVMQALLDRTYF